MNDSGAASPVAAAMADDAAQRFGGIERLYGRAALERLAAAHVCVIGLGGVGSWTVEALVRSGVGALTLVDLDDLCVTNVNRQIHALEGTIGRPKAEVLAERVRAIHPACRVAARVEFFADSSADHILGAARYDYVVDAIDSLKNKLLAISRCRAAGVPVVTVGGAGGRSDPTLVRVDDLAFSERDPLLRYVRKRLRERHAFSRDVSQPWGVPCVFSLEYPIYPQSDGTVGAEREPECEAAINCATGVGTASFVTGTFGFAAAGVVVRALATAAAPGRASPNS